MRNPIWTTPQFRWFIYSAVMAAAILAVGLLEIRPLVESRREESPEEKLRALDALLAGRADHVPVCEGWGEALAEVTDGVPLESEDAAYLAALGALRSLPEEALAAEAIDVDPECLALAPERLRGRVITLHAIFGDAESITVTGGARGPESIHRAVLVDPSGNQGFVVDLLRRPEDFERRELVSVPALFLRNVTYEGMHGPVVAPHFLGVRLRSLAKTQPRSTLETAMLPAIAVLLAGALLILALGTARRRRHGGGRRSATRVGANVDRLGSADPPRSTGGSGTGASGSRARRRLDSERHPEEHFPRFGRPTPGSVGSAQNRPIEVRPSVAPIFLGKSLCALCDQVMQSDQKIIGIPAIPVASPSLARFIDAGFHAECFSAWPLRPQFVGEINAHYDAHYRGMRFMNEDGSIEEREPRPAQPT